MESIELDIKFILAAKIKINSYCVHSTHFQLIIEDPLYTWISKYLHQMILVLIRFCKCAEVLSYRSYILSPTYI